jgi:hypothetical protein
MSRRNWRHRGVGGMWDRCWRIAPGLSSASGGARRRRRRRRQKPTQVREKKKGACLVVPSLHHAHARAILLSFRHSTGGARFT